MNVIIDTNLIKAEADRQGMSRGDLAKATVREYGTIIEALSKGRTSEETASRMAKVLGLDMQDVCIGKAPRKGGKEAQAS